MQSINPATNQVIRDYPEHSSGQVSEIIRGVHSAFNEWRRVPLPERGRLMRQAADYLKNNREQLALLMTEEMGKLVAEARAEIDKCAWVCSYYAENAGTFLRDEAITTDARESMVSFEPLGVVLAVMPWNFPFWQVFRFAAPALIAGNTAVLKHASNVPGCALAIEKVFHESGFPKDVFRTLMIGSDLVSEVIRHPAIKAVSLTGSTPAGKAVAAMAGSEIKKCVLELGGSDPFIVLEDADMQKCVQTSVQARMLNAGQSCIAAKRFIVVQSRLREFEQEHTRLMQNLKTGDPRMPDTQIGPMARMDLLEELDRQVQDSIVAGARLLTGGRRADRAGAYYLPTVLTDVRKGMPAYEQETFGPVTAIIPVKDEEEALRVANDTEFGLGASLWSEDRARARQLARSIEAGCVFINGMVKSDPRLPFGGVKTSGFGRELSHYGIKEFVNIKTIWSA